MSDEMPRPGPEPRVADEELIAAVEASETPIACARAVADRVGLSRQATTSRLTRLADEGVIESGRVGEATPVYWVPEEVTPQNQTQ